MKNLLFVAITTTLLVTTAQATQEAYQAGADQIHEIIKCQPLAPRADLAMSLTVSTGGIAGVTQVIVKKFYLGHSSSDTYMVKALTRPEGRVGEGITYVGENIRLTTNFTTQTPNGGHYGVLKIKENTSTSTTELSCELILQNPQVNYAY